MDSLLCVRLLVIGWLLGLPLALQGGQQRLTSQAGATNSGPPVWVTARVASQGPGLDTIEFTAVKSALSGGARVELQVRAPEARDWTSAAVMEMLPVQWEQKAALPIFPLSRPGTYHYRYKVGNSAWGSEFALSYQPWHRLAYVEGKGRVTWMISRLPKDDWAVPEIKTTRPEGAAEGWAHDLTSKSAFFRYTTAQNGETRRYVVQAAANALAEIELPYFYTFQIGGASQPTKVEIYETRDDACPLGYRYAITNKFGALTVLRNHQSDPLDWDFKNLVHYGRKPYEQWTIWALHQLSEMDAFSLNKAAQSQAEDWSKTQIENWIQGFNGLGHFRLSLVPSQSELIEKAGACLWNSAILSRLLEPVPQFMRDHAQAVRAGRTFAPTVNQYLKTSDQLDAAQKLFNIYGPHASSLWGPSYDRALYAYEWAFILAWLYGDLNLAGHPELGVIQDAKDVPADLLFHSGIIQIGHHPRGANRYLDATLEPRGTRWSARVTGRYAFTNAHAIWIDWGDDTPAKAVAAIPAGMEAAQIAWSKDASRLAFTAVTLDTKAMPVRGDVWTVKTDGTDLRPIARGEDPTTDPMGDTEHSWSTRSRDFFCELDFSPDGTQVASQHFRCYLDHQSNEGWRPTQHEWEDVELVVIPLSGAAPTTIPNSRWVRDQPYLSLPEVTSGTNTSLQWGATSWSTQDELATTRAYAACLSADVVPQVGVAGHTPFRFEAVFYDRYNHPPKKAIVHLNGQERELNFEGYLHQGVADWEDYAHGAIYSLTSALPAPGDLQETNCWFSFTTFRDGEVFSAHFSLDDWVSRPRLDSVQAELVNPAEAEEWGVYNYEVTANYRGDKASGGGMPYLVVQADAIGWEVYPMARVAGDQFRCRFTLPLSYRPGQTVTDTVQYWVCPEGEYAGGLGPFSLAATHTWPTNLATSASGAVSLTNSLSGSTTYKADIDADGEEETVTLSVTAGVSATRGRPEDVFCFRARYQNSADKPATRASIVIDGAGYEMEKTGRDGGQDIYEYRTSLAARKEKHPWSMLFSDGVGTVTAASTAEPWVAEVELGNPSVRRDPADSRQHVFQVTARQTAEQGQCWLFVQDAGGTPRAVVKMDKVSGSLATGAIFEKTLDLQERSYLVSPTGSTVTRTIRTGRGQQNYRYRFAFADGFDGGGTRLEGMLAQRGDLTPNQTLNTFVRNGYGLSSRAGYAWTDSQILLSPPGRAAVKELTLPDGYPHWGLAWDETGKRLALAGGSAGYGLVVYTNYGNGRFDMIHRSATNGVVWLGGWVADQWLAATRYDASASSWSHGLYSPDDGGFSVLHETLGDARQGSSSWPYLLPFPTRVNALCTEGALAFRAGDTGQESLLAAGQSSGYEPSVNEAVPTTPQTVDYPYGVETFAQAPNAAAALLPNDVSYSSSSVQLQPQAPGTGSAIAGLGDTVGATPTLAFQMSRSLDPAAAAGLEFQITGDQDQPVVAGILKDLVSRCQVRFQVADATLKITLRTPLAKGAYHATLTTTGLRGQEGSGQPEGMISGWFRVLEGLGKAGGVFSLPDSGVSLQVAAGALSAETAFDLAIATNGFGVMPAGWTPLRQPVAVAWTPQSALGSAAQLIFELWSTDIPVNFEPVAAQPQGTGWVEVPSTLTEQGSLIALPLTKPGVVGLFLRERKTPDLSLAAKTDRNVVAPGGILKCTVAVFGRSGAVASNLVLVCRIPDHCEYVAGSAAWNGQYDPASRTLTWTLPAVEPRTGLEATFEVRIASNALSTTPLSIEARLNGGGVAMLATNTDVVVSTQAVIEVTTDLEAARFVLAGGGAAQGIRYRGTGLWWTITNATPGTYTIQFESVAGYAPPAENGQSQSVEAGDVLRFAGHFLAETGTNAPPGAATNQWPHFGAGGMGLMAWTNRVALGAAWRRAVVDISTAQSQHTNLIDFAPFDAVVSNAQRYGLRTYAIADCVAAGGQWPAAEDFARAFTLFVERYDGDGVRDMPGLTQPIHHWEIFNEFGVEPGRWAGCTLEMYAQYLAAAYQAAHAADPAVTVLCGSFPGLYGITNFLAPLLTNYPATSKAFDAISFHSYWEFSYFTDSLGTRPQYLEAATLREWLAKLGLDQREIWLTEGDFSSTYDYWRNHGYNCSQTDSASFLARAYPFALASGIDHLIYTEFDWQPFFPDPLKWAVMLDENGHRRMNFYVYQKLIEKLEGCQSATPVDLGGNNIGAKFLSAGNQPVWVLWNWAGHTNEATLPVGLLTGVRVTGALPLSFDDQEARWQVTTNQVTNGVFHLTLTGTPVYLEGITAATEGFRISGIAISESRVRLVWPSTVGQRYQVQSSPDLNLNWTPAVNGTINATTTTTTWEEPVSAPAGRRFYRVLLISP